MRPAHYVKASSVLKTEYQKRRFIMTTTTPDTSASKASMQQSYKKYRPFPAVELADRTWPDQTITHAPIWCSVDLRDGNQSLIEPMDSPRKMAMFRMLVAMGFKEIEVGFPAASETDFNFCRELIDGGHIPNDVTIQVLTQAREHLVDRTFEALTGSKNAILHIYNSTSTLQRRVVFKDTREGVKNIAVNGAKMVADRIGRLPDTNLQLQYSPESFTGTELDYALEVCDAVMDVWQPTPDNKTIINLPSTVEMATPNIYADQIEWMCRQFSRRDSIIISLHPHNDRGCGVAATELGLMAGGDRVEGTLFGNGERTGNVDIVTMGLNMLTQGVNPELDFSDINALIQTAEFCNQLSIPERHPYAGSLVHTAFSGSHQDAIRKGMDAIAESDAAYWEVPYLPIDPSDIGRTYEAIIRVNSQSGKGGVAYLLESDHHIKLPRGAEIELSKAVQKVADTTGQEITSTRIYDIFMDEYINQNGPFTLISFTSEKSANGKDQEDIAATVNYRGEEISFTATGNGPISAFVEGIRTTFGLSFRLKDFGQNTRSASSTAESAAYVELAVPDDDGGHVYGVGLDTSITRAPIRAVVSALNRMV
jgi:2-isopropylmalate synthase